MRIICKRDRYRYIRLSLRFINRHFGIDHNTNFCIDTGAPSSLVTYEQAVEWSIPLNQLAPAPTQRVGGAEGPAYYMENSIMLFRDAKGKLNAVDVPKIIVLDQAFKTKPRDFPIPPLLGDDILSRFSLIVRGDRHGGEITLTDEDFNIVFPTIH